MLRTESAIAVQILHRKGYSLAEFFEMFTLGILINFFFQYWIKYFKYIYSC